MAFARANRLDTHRASTARSRRFGIVTTGKSYLDVRQALDDLGIDEAHAAEIGIAVYKVGMVLAARADPAFAASPKGLDEMLVVEEKRGIIEDQFKEQRYTRPKTAAAGARQVRRGPGLDPPVDRRTSPGPIAPR